MKLTEPSISYKTYGLLTAALRGKVEWRFGKTEDGGRCAMTGGTPRTPGLCAGASGIPEQVRSAAQSLEEGQEISSWMMFSATGTKQLSLIVPTKG